MPTEVSPFAVIGIPFCALLLLDEEIFEALKDGKELSIQGKMHGRDPK